MWALINRQWLCQGGGGATKKNWDKALTNEKDLLLFEICTGWRCIGVVDLMAASTVLWPFNKANVPSQNIVSGNRKVFGFSNAFAASVCVCVCGCV